MKRNIIVFSIILAMMFSSEYYIAGSARDTLCTPNSSKEAVALYRYLNDMKGKKILAGQMWVPWGNDAFNYVNSVTGKSPAIMGIDFINEYENSTNVTKALNWAKSGGIVTAMWHQGAPSRGEGYEMSQVFVDIDSCFIPGTPVYTAYRAALKKKADWLVQFRDAKVPVLWRPYHECSGNWFWWSKGGPAKFIQLWDTMYHYFVYDRGLNNLIWVLCFAGIPGAAWYPGDQYVDIAGADGYPGGPDPQLAAYNLTKTITNDQFPMTYHECGVPLSPVLCLSKGAMWSWWMEWHTDKLTSVDSSYLISVYNNDLIVTLDKLPDIDSIYGWNADSCTASAIIPNIRIDSGLWMQNNIARIGIGSSVKLSPTCADSGTWSWSGCGLSDTAREQTVPITSPCVSTATFRNNCGATSTQTFDIVDCLGTDIMPNYKIDSGAWRPLRVITIYRGSTLSVSPTAADSGTWSWSGCGMSDTSRILTFQPDSFCNLKATFTNACGTPSSTIFYIKAYNHTGISDVSDNSNVKLYPDPCKELLNIEFQRPLLNRICYISIYTIQGALVLNKSTDSDNITLNTSQLKPNIYFVKIVNSNFEILRKFVKVE